MPASRVTEIVDDLVCAEYNSRRRLRIRAELHVQILVDLDIRKDIQSRKREVTNGNQVVETAVSQPDLVQHIRGKVVKRGEGNEFRSGGTVLRERGQVGRYFRIDARVIVA